MNTRAAFEDENIDFDRHKHVDHEAWIYVYYIKYLQEKNIEDLNGDEISVFSDYKDHQSIKWMPDQETSFLQKSHVSWQNVTNS